MRSRLSRLTADDLLSNLLLYFVLAGYILLLYGTVVVVLLLLNFKPTDEQEAIFSTQWWVYAIVIILVALTLLPVRRWLQIRINAMIYGQYDDPYTLISTINSHLQAMNSPQMTLPIVAQTIARTLKLPYIAIRTSSTSTPFHYEFGSKPAQSEVTTLPLLYLEKAMGELTVSSRRAHESLSGLDVRLLGDLARQIGVALHVVQLTEEQQASRERLVISREEERRRIRNDLHDGLGPTLSSLQLQLGAMRNLIRQNPDQAEAIAHELRDDLRQATAEIRQLVYDLRPPLLDELGLVEAIKSCRVQASEVNLEVIAPEPMPRLSAALEVAIYRIVSEAIHNVIRHAQASECIVCLEVGHATLKVVVADNGKGLPDAAHVGVGLLSMKERATELGGMLSILPGEKGGVEVVALFPVNG